MSYSSAESEPTQPITEPSEQIDAEIPFGDNAILVDGQQVGYVDRDGNIRLSSGDRVIGHIANDREHAISVLRERYEQYVQETLDWCEESTTAENRLWRIRDCDRRMEEIGDQYVLGTFDEIRTMLTDLKAKLLQEQQERIASRDQLIADASKLSERTDWKDAGIAFDELNTAFKTIGTVGDRDKDNAQWDAFKNHERAFRARRQEHFDKQQQEFAARAQAKEQLCEEAESLQESNDFKAAGQQFRSIMDRWKEVGFAGREHDEALWQRFQSARNTFGDRRKVWFEENAAKKEVLASQAEELAAMDDAAAAQQRMKPLMQQWRDTGSAGKSADDALWTRFRGAQETVYQRSRSVFDARQQEREANYEAKQALIQEVESLIGQDSRTATSRCKEIQQEWKKIGPVPRERSDKQWNQFRAACDSIFRIASAEGRRRIDDARDRAEANIRKLSDEIGEHERKIAHWEGVIENLRDGANADEIRESMQEKIATAKERIEIKLGWIEEQHARMTELAQRR